MGHKYMPNKIGESQHKYKLSFFISLFSFRKGGEVKTKKKKTPSNMIQAGAA